jgi:hypothetical protein
MTIPSAEKRRIRRRDQSRIALTGQCVICGGIGVETSRHHLWYPKEFDRNAVIVVCDICDDKIHGREDMENLGRAINAIQNLTIVDGDVWLGDVRIGTTNVGKDGSISINMTKR